MHVGQSDGNELHSRAEDSASSQEGDGNDDTLMINTIREIRTIRSMCIAGKSINLLALVLFE